MIKTIPVILTPFIYYRLVSPRFIDLKPETPENPVYNLSEARVETQEETLPTNKSFELENVLEK
jgi:hypothetical protein